jgi:hypothetical protein
MNEEKNRRIHELMGLISPLGYIVLWAADDGPMMSKSGINNEEAVTILMNAISWVGHSHTIDVPAEQN